MQIPFDQVVQKIKDEKGLSDEEINQKIKEKLDQLSGLISKEGAAHIIANELGIKVIEAPQEGPLKIKNIYAGMRNIDIIGKPVQIYEVRTFQKQNGEGKVGTFLLADETATMRVVCWGAQADILNKLTNDTVVKVQGVYAKENRGRVEVHANDKSSFELNPAGVTVTPVQPGQSSAQRKLIKSLEGTEERVEVGGTIIQVFDLRFYSVCPQCGKRAKEDNGVSCPAHGAIQEPAYNCVLNLVLDDGSGTVRCGLFKKQVEALLEKPYDQILPYKDAPLTFDDMKTALLGEIVVFTGRAQKNEMFNRVEFVPFFIDRHPDPEKELEKIKSLQ